MGLPSQIISVVCRVGELISASVVAGLVGEYLHYINDANAHAGSRFVYTVALAGISIFFSLVLMPPLKYSFWAFPLDLSLFIMWMVSFGLLEGLTGSSACNSFWYWNSWGYFWGGYYRYVPVDAVTQSLVGTSACGKWRATLAWSFIGGFAWLISAILGFYVILRDRDASRTAHSEMREQVDDGAEGINANPGQPDTHGQEKV